MKKVIVLCALSLIGFIYAVLSGGTSGNLKAEDTMSFGQLEKLKKALSNPLEQYVGIVFIGDSITWGMTATGNPVHFKMGRDGTLSDIRDNFESLSFVNRFKRYIGSEYMAGSPPLISNWKASPSGESIVEFNKEFILFPEGENFEVTTEGNIDSYGVMESEGDISKKQLYFQIDPSSDGAGIIRFKFTGKQFTLAYESAENSMDYELFVDGVSHGFFTTRAGFDGNSPGTGNMRTHRFDYVQDALIEIRTVKIDSQSIQTFKIGGIIVDKTVQISNQGIIGATAKTYIERNLDGNTSGDGTAIHDEDRYIFIQLGTNDRREKDSAIFKRNLQNMIDNVKSNRALIVMCANPVSNQNPDIYHFTMQETCNAIKQAAEENQIDFINNYTIFQGMNASNYLADSLHPNDYGHDLIFQNIVNSLEQWE
ncbi:MAG TPA: SGNH/GDSL hydrolase family protein [Bacillus sp. (in: firmicutes)]|uniref:SGNH/GDSL hydrolase family protein n=1 Tax=Bacillus litorisediminis TaxID=2922713 RepID=UPI001FAE1734|nr:SGNH/GDSL hydrolase family protein [Bacillus litorisediminis]HWO76780.1 SGNH/GDSL hydrolase family protein [Bacillus sp. (in: firmicutes)]